MSNDLMTLDAEQLELLAQQAVNTEVSTQNGATMISTRAGRMSIKGMPIPNDSVVGIVLCSPIERLFYFGDFDGEKLVAPDCAAMATMASELQPFPSAVHPQHPTCEGCPKDVWGSASTPEKARKGKACRETRRIVFVTADEASSPENVSKIQSYALRPPVTSLANYSAYVKQIAITLRKPLFAVKTKIWLVPDAKSQFKMKFEFVEEIKDTATLIALMNRSQKELGILLSNNTVSDFQSLSDSAVIDDSDTPF